MARYWSAVLTLLFVATTAYAQDGQRKYVILVDVESTDWRVQPLLPELRGVAAEEAEHSAKNVIASIVMDSPSDVAEQARQRSADYLLTIKLMLVRQVSVPSKIGLGNGPPTTADVPVVGGVPSGINHAGCDDLLNEVFMYSYTVTALAAEKINLQGSHTIGENEYPLGPETSCLPKFSTHAVHDCASAAVKKLKSKKRL